MWDNHALIALILPMWADDIVLVRRLFLLTLLLASALPIYAVNVDDLYETEVLIADTSDAGRSDGELRALQAVLVKLTGDRNVDVLATLALYDSSVSTLARQTQVRTSTERGTDRLWVRFDTQKIDRLLADASVARWGNARPMTALLIAVDDGAERTVLSAGGGQGLAEMVNLAARRRGIPTVLPLMDLRDQRDLSHDDIMRADGARLDTLRSRYRGEAVVFGSLTKAGQIWESSWTMSIAGSERHWRSRGAPNQLLDDMIETLADELATRFASAPSASGVVNAAMTPAGVSANQGLTPKRTLTNSASGTSSATSSRSALRGTAPLNTVSAQTLGSRSSAAVGPAPAAIAQGGLLGLRFSVVGVRSARAYGTLVQYFRELDSVTRVSVTGLVGDRLELAVLSSIGDAGLQATIEQGFTLTRQSGTGQLIYRLR